mmetsp:Transcript_41929/g.80204  ORF Transcript_41929/g.80204 Transcript_41929/m.80204 type:complete len:119 (-) Transcript_41929:346-702(-)
MANKHPFCQHQMLPLALCKGSPLEQQLILRSRSTQRPFTAITNTSDLIRTVNLRWDRTYKPCSSSLSSKPCSSTTIKYQLLLHPTKCPAFLCIFFSRHNSMGYFETQNSMLESLSQRI